MRLTTGPVRRVYDSKNAVPTAVAQTDPGMTAWTARPHIPAPKVSSVSNSPEETLTSGLAVKAIQPPMLNTVREGKQQSPEKLSL